MLASLKKLLGSPGARPSCLVGDPILGELQLSEGGKWWEGSITVSGQAVGFKIGGGAAPDAALVTHARDIVGTFPGFQKMIREFLADEARRVKHLKRFADEIEQLRIEDICLFWPRRPDDGMIYFKGPDRYRVWRCDYVGRKPKGLGFDD